ncbi:glycosyltransferase family 39 protein [Sphingobium yanoikuyae]|jgi:hypothetical protein|uniref:glycosyltransferase family 39 protein n=1 Tax=Sphingobium yanoikuyae TaxID=13690 RepID=UPI0028AE62BD|nr:glycosyltransferase family 39 protein [Sphingobium yanoikuyae]
MHGDSRAALWRPSSGWVPKRWQALTPARFLIYAILAFVLIGLFGRVVTFPLGHDEQIHVSAGQLLFQAPLYQALGYNHLPGLPLLLHTLYALTGDSYLLLKGRLLIFLCWIATGLLLYRFALRQAGDRHVALAALLVLVAGVLIGPAGMLVTNNFLPVPFAILSFDLFLRGLDEGRIRAGLLFLSGLAMGFAAVLKVSYVFLGPPFALAALLLPRALPFGERVRRVFVPLIIGGLVGCSPALVVLISDPYGLFAHTVRYFSHGHLAYWEQATAAKAMSFPEKIMVAEGVWLAGSGLLALILAGVFAGTLVRRAGAAALAWWPIPLAAALAAFGALGAFVPTPAFPQYYEPPVPFFILLFILLYRRLDAEARHWMAAVLGSVGALALISVTPRLAAAVPGVAQPVRWTGTVTHEQGQQIRAVLDRAGARGRVATLSPIAVLEGGLPIYREFAAGPFLYRVAQYLPAADRPYFTTTTPHGLSAFLDADPPAAILVGEEGELDAAFASYARLRGYRLLPIGGDETRLFVRPDADGLALLERGVSHNGAPLSERTAD